MATQSQRRASTREAILTAAQQLFDRRGFAATTVDEITAAADVAKGTFYQHFATKDEILRALIRRHQSTSLEDVEKQLGSGRAPLQLGATLVKQLGQSCERHKKSLGQMMAAEMHNPPKKGEPSTREMFARVFAEAQRRGVIRPDVDAYELAVIFLGGLLPAMSHWAAHGKKGELINWMEKAWRVFLEGAACKEKKSRKL
jgi:AcrR family transcriptional regulator